MKFTTIRQRAAIVCASAVLVASPIGASASIIYSTLGASYGQDFNTLPTTPENVSLGASPTGWKNDDPAPAAGNFSIVGWYLFHPASQTEGGFDGHQRMRIGAGTANTGAFMSYGTSASTERAMGSQVSSATVPATPGQQYIAMRLTNSVGFTLDSFTLSYDGEQWRDGGAATPASKTMQLQWSSTATAINDSAAYTAEPTLNFTTPVFANTGSGAAVNGNTTGKVSIGPVTVTGINWQPGTDLWVRWLDPRSAGNNHGMGIDNVSFSAIPEPSAAVLLLAGATALARRRRRNRI